MPIRQIIKKQLQLYLAIFPEERILVEECLAFLELTKDNTIFNRQGDHFTVTCMLLDHSLRHQLLVLHKSLNLWLPPGGHIEGCDTDLCAAAAREVYEEVGIKNLNFLTSDIWSLEKHDIRALLKNSECKNHYDLRFIAVAPEGAACTLSDESLAVSWAKIPQQEREENDKRLQLLLKPTAQ